MAPTQFLNTTCLAAVAANFKSGTNFTTCRLPIPNPPDLDGFGIFGTITACVAFVAIVAFIAFVQGCRHAEKSVIEILRNDYHSYELHEEVEKRYLATMNLQMGALVRGRYESVTHGMLRGRRVVTVTENLFKAPVLAQTGGDWRAIRQRNNEAWEMNVRAWGEHGEARRSGQMWRLQRGLPVTMEVETGTTGLQAPPPAYSSQA